MKILLYKVIFLADVFCNRDNKLTLLVNAGRKELHICINFNVGNSNKDIYFN